MYLFVLILDKAADLEKIIEAFKEIGITGATVFDSIGLGRNTLYNVDQPIIASLARVFDPEQRTYNHTMINVIKTEKTLEDAFRVAGEICGDFNKPDVGIMFAVKLDRVVGFQSPMVYKRDDDEEKC